MREKGKEKMQVYYSINIKGIIGEGEREREGKEKWGKKPGRAKKKRSLEKAIRLHLALRPSHPTWGAAPFPFAPDPPSPTQPAPGGNLDRRWFALVCAVFQLLKICIRNWIVKKLVFFSRFDVFLQFSCSIWSIWLLWSSRWVNYWCIF